ncbi:RNA polymerase sigma factor RpoD/SigA [Chloroflexus sp.]|uniref:sigma-70 family RNA polymerase sigma factor n=1 Tax=Chloroflexus sp. TaxID=1904827 RepID=UPI00298ED8F1|nr:sigma-70 family RNA polymerase sigma factor [Chloroflexus sp.]MDW8403001.1 sigma-70 family RNA polymerase sigma factor [Chloroflexus sp.]
MAVLDSSRHPPPLSSLEQHFAQELENVTLIGELQFTRELVTNIADTIRSLVGRYSFAEASRILTQQYPCTLAVYLVGQGIYGYQGGNYWSGLIEAIGNNGVREWGPFFLSFLQQRDLPTFRDLGGHAYVTSILIHGGIPEYSLPDFFHYVLEPVSVALVSSDVDIEESILDILADLARRAPADRPIERFLTHGGAFARDFVARSLELAHIVRERGTVPDPVEVGLPAWVVSRYAEWSRGRIRQRSDVTWRPRRPEFWFDPWGDGLLVDLPAQHLPDGSQPSACWRIQQDGIIRVRKVMATASGDGWETMPDQLALNPAEQGYHIEFLDGRGLSHQWMINLWPDRVPLLAFEPTTGSYIRTLHGLPARPLWLLTHISEELKVIGGQRLSELPQLEGAWFQYRIEHWDIGQARLVYIGDREIPVLPDENVFRPRLGGGATVDLGLRSVELPIYEGQPPVLMIPIAPQRNAQQELTRWRISLNVGNTPILRQVSLVDITYAIYEHDGNLHVDLTRLTTAPFGRFSVTLRGPLGRDRSFQFGLIPRLSIKGQYRVRVADGTGILPAGVLRLVTDPAIDLTSIDRILEVTSEDNGVFTIVAPPELTLARLVLQWRKDRSQELPLTLPLPLIHWSLTGTNSGWFTTPIVYSQDWLDQVEAPELQIRCEPPLGFTTEPRVELIIRDPEGQYTQHLRARGNMQHGWRFVLREALDTIRSSEEAHYQGWIQITNLGKTPSFLFFPALRIVQETGVSKLDVTVLERSGNWIVRVAWQQNRQLRRRKLLFWPIWRPWQQPIELPIPDTAINSHEEYIPRADLPPGRYRTELTIDDPWLSVMPQRPMAGASGTVEVSVAEQAARAMARVAHDMRGALTLLLSAPDPETMAHAALLCTETSIETSTAVDLLHTLAILSDDPKRAVLLQNPTWNGLAGLRALARRAGLDLLRAVFQYAEQFPKELWATLTRCLESLHPDIVAVLTSVHQTGSVQAHIIERIAQLAAAPPDACQELHSWFDDQNVLVIESDQAFDHYLIASETIALTPPIPASLLRDSLGCYLHQIGQIALLQPEEELQLARLVEKGRQAEALLRTNTYSLRRTAELRQAVVAGNQARHKLIMANLRLVVNLSRRYRGRGLDELDLIQEGNLGLMRAVEKFDSARGFRFSTYATWWVKQALSRAVADLGRLVRLPVHLHEQISRLMAVQRQLLQQLNREPSERELASALGISERKVVDLLSYAQHPLSLEMPIGEEQDSTLGSMIADPMAEDSIIDGVLRTEIKGFIPDILAELTERQRLVLSLRYGLHDGQERTLEEVGQSLGVTRERVRQIESKSLKQLQKSLVLKKKCHGYLPLTGDLEAPSSNPVSTRPELPREPTEADGSSPAER